MLPPGVIRWGPDVNKVRVFLTVDVEMWPPAWGADLGSHQEAFRRYVHGVGNPPRYGLPYQLKVLADHGLKGVFFVEPLFASVLGRGALEEVVGLIRESGQDLQLHLHPEWLGRARSPELPGPHRLALRHMTLGDQTWLIRLGRRWLEKAGAEPIQAFRAGGFGANRDTWKALAANGIGIDFSQNRVGPWGPIEPASPEDVTMGDSGIAEVGLTTYKDIFGRRRPLQVGSSGYAEMEEVLFGCVAKGRRTAVILSHSSELLNGSRIRKDPFVSRRFLKLCSLLDRNRDCLMTAHTSELPSLESFPGPEGVSHLRSTPWATVWRYSEQVARRFL